MKRLLLAAALGAALLCTTPIAAAPHLITALGMIVVDASFPAPPPEAALVPVAPEVSAPAPVAEPAPSPVEPPVPYGQRWPSPRFIGPPVQKP